MATPWLGSSLRRLCASARALALPAFAAFLALAAPVAADHDTSAPVVSYTLTGTAGSNGWYGSNVTINWSVVEPEGLTSTSGCEIAQLVSSEGQSSHTCTAASHGGTVSSTVTLKIDKTLPSVPVGTAARAADANGWYNHAVAVAFAGTDAVSGIDTCSGNSYGGPDSATASVPGSCTDKAGNTSSGAFSLSYDSTPPTPTAAASRAPDANGWYNRALTISFAQAPGDLSGPGSCRAPVSYGGPDSGAASVAGSCTDRAGNTSAPVALAFKYDATAPSALAATSRAPDANGWFNRALTVSFAQAPGDLSGPDTCSAPANYSGPDAADVSRSGTCTDKAGNTSSPASLAFKYDATPPSASGSLARGPDRNGWYNHAVALDVTGTDALSGVASCTNPSYSGPDGATREVAGTCTDRAGNVSAPASATLKYDATPPGATATPNRGPDANGWYNRPLTISFGQAPGDVSGPDTCTPAVGYSGPDSASVSRSGSCTDKAGNTSAAVALMFKYDATPPTALAAASRAPDANGWFNRPLTVSFSQAAGDLSGADSCSAPVSYSGPDAADVSRSGTCTDKAGNTSSPASLAFSYDATPPSATGALARGPDVNGWYNRPVALDVTGTDATSGVASCVSPSYAGPDGAAREVSGTCTDRAGNVSDAASATIKYDATPPAATAAASRAPDSNGWYNRPLTISFAQVAGDVSGPDTCSPPAGYSGPDDASASRSGTCTDKAGNTSVPATLTLKYDATPPAASGALARPPDANGWYNHPVALGVTGTDAMSGLASCSGPSYSGPDGAARTITGSCTDRAGNTNAAVTATLKYDATPPTASGSLARGPDANGWYNHPVALELTGSDATSGIASCSGGFAGPDGDVREASGTCTDVAGNASTPVTAALKYDATPPSAKGTLARAPDVNGWYNRPVALEVTGADATSGLAGCVSPSYAGPDGAAREMAGTCADRAGNTSAPATATIKYDATAPAAVAEASRAPDANGWYNRPLTIAFAQVAGDVSGPDTCSPSVSYAGPDDAGVSRSGSCTDRAGNTSSPVALAFKYDATPPTATGSLARAADANGWYNHPVALDVTGTDATSGIGSCGGASFVGPASPAAVVAGGCTDVAGNASAAVTETIKYDATPPSTSVGLGRAPDSNGWYNRPVSAGASGHDSVSGVASCSGSSYAGPDSGAAALTGSCRDVAGNESSASVSLRYDATAPSLRSIADRAPDGRGWYRRALTVTFVGADAVSGVASCTAPARYAGPDRLAASVVGSCRDAAGNTAELAHRFQYDATAPKLGKPKVEIERRMVRIGWERPADAASVELLRAPGVNGARSSIVYRGTGRSFADRTVREGIRYRYTIRVADLAGNVAEAVVSATARPPLYRPARGAVVRPPLAFAWEPVEGVSFYNFQLLRDGVKVLSTWPRVAGLRLGSSWRYAGKGYRLEPGLYRWYVWAARGSRERPVFGRPLGSSSFVVKGS